MSLSCGPKIGSELRGDSHLCVKFLPFYPYNATFFSPPFLGAYDARHTLGDCAVGPRLRRRGAPQSYTHAGATRLRITGGAATPLALALFFPKRPFKCQRKKCASIVSNI